MSISKIGTNVNNVTDLLLEPIVEFFLGAETEENACNETIFVGRPRCRWTYPGRLLTGEQFHQLKSIVGDNPSASVIIDIPTQTMAFETYTPLVTTYQAVMHWPQEGVKLVNYNRWQFPEDGILFTRLTPL